MTQVQICDLRIGQRVDLEADLYADPDYHVSGDAESSEHPEFQFDYEVVRKLYVERVGADACTVAEFESGFACGFPPDHLVDVDPEQTFVEFADVAGPLRAIVEDMAEEISRDDLERHPDLCRLLLAADALTSRVGRDEWDWLKTRGEF